MAAIQQIDDNTFTLFARGSAMTLKRNADRTWTMSVDNASRRAWGTLGMKDFGTLAEVEQHYKSWRGITKLIA